MALVLSDSDHESDDDSQTLRLGDGAASTSESDLESTASEDLRGDTLVTVAQPRCRYVCDLAMPLLYQILYVAMTRNQA